MAETDNPLDTPFDIARADVLGAVPHGFFGSGGGVHQFGYGGPGDAEAIRRLRSAAASAILPGAPLAAPHQVHSPEVVTIDKKWPDAARDRPVADAVVTNRTDVVLGIVTADCGPILLADADAGVVAAAHAGWRGAQSVDRGGVLENTITAMEALGAVRKNIAAALGPTIAQPSYEVDAAFREYFTDPDETFFSIAPMREDAARWHFDLPAYILEKLRQSGLTKVAALHLDTFTQGARYHSFRRASQLGEPTYGRQLSAIAVPARGSI
jgi:YfiH family protein